jgi:hypothetical protein
MQGLIAAELYCRAVVDELDREAERICRAQQARGENSRGSSILPFGPRQDRPFSGLHPRSVYR